MKFSNDKFKKNRGGYSRWLKLNCEKCKHQVLLYQKNGPGILKRLYFDRINTSKNTLSKNKNLICQKCKTVLGVPIIYQKEKRLSYRLFAGAVEKQIFKTKSKTSPGGRKTKKCPKSP